MVTSINMNNKPVLLFPFIVVYNISTCVAACRFLLDRQSGESRLREQLGVVCSDPPEHAAVSRPLQSSVCVWGVGYLNLTRGTFAPGGVCVSVKSNFCA